MAKQLRPSIAEEKAKILSMGININQDDLACIDGYKYSSLAYNDSSPRAVQLRRSSKSLPQELILIGEDGCSTCVSCIVDPSSPLSIERQQEQLYIKDLTDNNSSLIPVQLPSLPLFWNKRTNSGKSMLRILSTCGLCQANIWLWHECAYVFDGSQCRFCGIALQSKRKTHDMTHLKDWLSLNAGEVTELWEERRNSILADIYETIQTAVNDYYHDHIHLMFISGNLPNAHLDLQWMMYVDVMKHINTTYAPLFNLDAISLLMPPNDFTWIEKAFQAGLRKIAFNLEVWNEQLFTRVMPGKTQYGRQKMLQALAHAVSVFGKGNVYTNLIIGLEPDIELLDGAHELAKGGIVANPIVFHQDYGAPWSKHPRPTTQSILWTTKQVAKIYEQYHFQPLYCTLGARTSLINEALQGWLY